MRACLVLALGGCNASGDDYSPTYAPTRYGPTYEPSKGGCLDVVMHDAWGDGWGGAALTVADADEGEVVYAGSVRKGSSETARLCLEDGCYLASVDGDEEYPSDVSFAIDGHGGAGAPYGPVAFFASGGSVIRWGYCSATAKPAVAPIARGTDEPASALTDREMDEIAEIFKTDPRWRQLWQGGQKSIEEKEERIWNLITEQNLLETYDIIDRRDPNQLSDSFRRFFRQWYKLHYLQKKATIQKHRAKRILNAVEEFRFDSSEAGHLEKLEELAALGVGVAVREEDAVVALAPLRLRAPLRRAPVRRPPRGRHARAELLRGAPAAGVVGALLAGAHGPGAVGVVVRGRRVAAARRLERRRELHGER